MYSTKKTEYLSMKYTHCVTTSLNMDVVGVGKESEVILYSTAVGEGDKFSH